MPLKITTRLDEHGDLILTADDEARAELQEIADYSKREDAISEALHERYDFITPESIGALTDAPILCASDDWSVEDDGAERFEPNARIFWFKGYQVTDPWETLILEGSVRFDRARE